MGKILRVSPYSVFAEKLSLFQGDPHWQLIKSKFKETLPDMTLFGAFYQNSCSTENIYEHALKLGLEYCGNFNRLQLDVYMNLKLPKQMFTLNIFQPPKIIFTRNQKGPDEYQFLEASFSEIAKYLNVHPKLTRAWPTAANATSIYERRRAWPRQLQEALDDTQYENLIRGLSGTDTLPPPQTAPSPTLVLKDPPTSPPEKPTKALIIPRSGAGKDSPNQDKGKIPVGLNQKPPPAKQVTLNPTQSPPSIPGSQGSPKVHLTPVTPSPKQQKKGAGGFPTSSSPDQLLKRLQKEEKKETGNTGEELVYKHLAVLLSQKFKVDTEQPLVGCTR
jgi:hypothetical protein